MKAAEYKKYKGIRKESLRDNMTDIEVALTNIGEIATCDIVREEHPQGLKGNLNVAKINPPYITNNKRKVKTMNDNTEVVNKSLINGDNPTYVKLYINPYK